jgi:hypothetical protein
MTTVLIANVFLRMESGTAGGGVAGGGAALSRLRL